MIKKNPSGKKAWLDNIKFNLGILSKASTLGFILSLPPVILAFLGVFLDKTLNTKPILTIIFIFLGTIFGIVSVVKESKKI